MRNAYAPVALFDKDYDNLGIAPFTQDGMIPEIHWQEPSASTTDLSRPRGARQSTSSNAAAWLA